MHPSQDRRLIDRCAKTRYCKFFSAGKCSLGAKCSFAHDPSELVAAPDLRCTKMCPAIRKTGWCTDSSCSFAHSRDELRKVSLNNQPEGVPGRRPRAPPLQGPGLVSGVGLPEGMATMPTATNLGETPSPPEVCAREQRDLFRDDLAQPGLAASVDAEPCYIRTEHLSVSFGRGLDAGCSDASSAREDLAPARVPIAGLPSFTRLLV
mmetsp:Transcript_3396/g.9713  ORF Transcript_3396/g.9713 Transcript_3396/m.9713 type:complete len:207 (-) Transcript_3396:55-675(-)